MKNLCDTCIAYYDTKETPTLCKFKKTTVTDQVETCESYVYFEVHDNE